MSNRKFPPPFCYMCKDDFEKEVDMLYYCICDTALCDDCINSVKINENEWECPKCKNINKIRDSKLFREKKI